MFEVYTKVDIQKKRWQVRSLFQNGKEFHHTLSKSWSTSPRKRKPPHMDTNQNVRQHPVSAQNNKNSLKIINIIDPVTWSNQDLHSTKQNKYNKEAIIKWECVWRHIQNHFVLKWIKKTALSKPTALFRTVKTTTIHKRPTSTNMCVD